MPVLLRYRGNEYRFRAGDREEPPHVHVRGTSGGQAKVWLAPRVRLHKAARYSERQVNEIIQVAEAHQYEWLAA